LENEANVMNVVLVALLFVAQVKDADTRTLLGLEDDWARALVQRDTVVFERLLAPGFVYTEDDKTMDRATVLHEVAAGADTVSAAHNEDMQVHRFGTTALVTGWLVVQGRGARGAFDRHYRFTDTWVKRGGRWQIVGAQDYVVPASRVGG
jgi:ketosteroid isomerase-like protein